MTAVKTGLEQWSAEGFRPLQGLRVGLLVHQASVDRALRSTVALMHASGVRVAKLFGPEHGLLGARQDMESVDGEGRDRLTGATIYSLYGDTESSLTPTEAMFEGLDVLVVDLQDVGTRYYTYAATMGYALETAARVGLRVVILDRPNPLGGRGEDIEGPGLDPAFRSLVGAYDLAVRHGLTMGEYARYIQKQVPIDVELEVVPMEGWDRSMHFEDTGLPWVMPSPNMPTIDTARIYPGQCLLEGTNLSEGRGTTKPFELCGAPFLDGHRWADALRPLLDASFLVRPTVICPTFQKHARQLCGALEIHVRRKKEARSLALSIALLTTARRLAPDDFAWRTEPYEFVSHLLAIDLLFGSDKPRLQMEAGVPVQEILESFRPAEEAFNERRQSSLLYPSFRS